MAEERLQKVLARAGIGSRRKAEALIEAGRVSVNGEVVRTMGLKIDRDVDAVAVDGRAISEETKEYWLLHKPPGVITTMDDPWRRPTARRLIPTTARVYPVGRLDADSSGLLLFTNDGDLAFRLTHPRFQHEREYLVRVDRRPDTESLRRLRRGVELDGRRTGPVEVAVDRVAPDGTWLRVVLREGRKRQIRRMMDLVGHPVRELVRVRMGSLVLGDLPEGSARRLTAAERANLRAEVLAEGP